MKRELFTKASKALGELTDDILLKKGLSEVESLIFGLEVEMEITRFRKAMGKLVDSMSAEVKGGIEKAEEVKKAEEDEGVPVANGRGEEIVKEVENG